MMSSSELLECASLIISASEDTLYEPVVEYRTGRVPFSELPVNLVMEKRSSMIDLDIKSTGLPIHTGAAC